jgi:hypothetical protein
MKLLKLFLSFSLIAFSLTTLAATAVAPANRIRIWEGSAMSFPDSQYSIGTTTVMGTIKTLKSNPTVINLLTNLNVASNTGGLDMSRYPGAKLETVTTFNNGPHQRLSDVGIPSGQCVAFARSMTGATRSDTWYPGNTLSSYLNFNGTVRPDIVLAPGTMIAHFGGKTRYDYNGSTPHVAIFLSWSKNAQGIVDGINVVDENIAWTIAGNSGSAAGLIQKHKLAWKCTASNCGTASGGGSSTYHITFFASNYHVVDVR